MLKIVKAVWLNSVVYIDFVELLWIICFNQLLSKYYYHFSHIYQHHIYHWKNLIWRPTARLPSDGGAFEEAGNHLVWVLRPSEPEFCLPSSTQRQSPGKNVATKLGLFCEEKDLRKKRQNCVFSGAGASPGLSSKARRWIKVTRK